MVLSHAVVWVKPVLKVRGLSSRYGVPEAFKPAKEPEFSVNADVALPSRSGWVVSDANKPRLVSLGDAQVSRVFSLGNLSEILDSVVRSVAVDVINLINRLSAMNPSPSHSVRSNHFASIMPRFVSVPIHPCERRTSSVSAVKHSAFLLWRHCSLRKVLRRHVFPSEIPGKRIVVKKAANLFDAHSKPLWLIPECDTLEGGLQHVR